MRSIVERPMPVSRCTRCLLRPAATAARTRVSRSRVTVTHSMSRCSASSGAMSCMSHTRRSKGFIGRLARRPWHVGGESLGRRFGQFLSDFGVHRHREPGQAVAQQLNYAREAIAADPDPHPFYVATSGDTVLKYSGATNVVTGTASISGLPRGVTATPDTGTAYATVSTGTTGVSLIDEATATVTGT